MASFGQRLKELRDEFDLTQEELVAAFEVKFPDVPLDKSKLSRYENGRTKPARFDVVECLSYFFEVTPGYPVSYTHLDVYKRQLLLSEFQMIPGPVPEFQLHAIGNILPAHFHQEKDVYKRQL